MKWEDPELKRLRKMMLVLVEEIDVVTKSCCNGYTYGCGEYDCGTLCLIKSVLLDYVHELEPKHATKVEFATATELNPDWTTTSTCNPQGTADGKPDKPTK
jgi:hypothetical protein